MCKIPLYSHDAVPGNCLRVLRACGAHPDVTPKGGVCRLGPQAVSWDEGWAKRIWWQQSVGLGRLGLVVMSAAMLCLTQQKLGSCMGCIWVTFSRDSCLAFRELLWFLSFCSSTELVQIPVSARQFLKAICSHIHLPLPTPTLKSFYCFLHIAFSQLLPASTKQHSKGGYEIFCILAGLMFSTSVLY